MLRAALSVSAYTHDVAMLSLEAASTAAWARVRGISNSRHEAYELFDFPPLVAHWAPPRRWWLFSSYLIIGFFRINTWFELYCLGWT